MARDSAAVRIFPPAVPLVTILLGEGLDRLWPLLGEETGLPAPLRYGLGGALMIGALLGLGLWSVLVMRRSGQNENPWKPSPSLLERGPFTISRNPMYLQMLLICIGAAVASWNLWTLALTPLSAWLLQRLAIEPEEAYLEEKFGEAYRSYKRRVRRWI